MLKYKDLFKYGHRGIQHGPDVHYQYNLEVLGKLAPMLREAFNREYESGEKTISDYYKDRIHRTGGILWDF